MVNLLYHISVGFSLFLLVHIILAHTVPEWMYSWKYVKAYAEKTVSHVKTAVIYGNCNERNCINSDLSVFFGNKFSYDKANNKFVIVPDDMEHYIRMIALFKELEIELNFSDFLTCRDMGNNPYLRHYLTLTRFIMLSFILSF